MRRQRSPRRRDWQRGPNGCRNCASNEVDPEIEAAVTTIETAAKAGTVKPRTRENSKQAIVIAMLKRPEVATIAQIVEVTSWQSHTVRGTFAGAFKKKLGLTIASTKDAGGQRNYRITSCYIIFRFRQPLIRSRPVQNLKWSDSEKKLSRRVFEAALEAELAEIMTAIKAKVAVLTTPDEMWALQGELARKQREVEEKYDYRYSQLLMVFSRLLRERRVTREQLRGLSDEKLSLIERLLSL